MMTHLYALLLRLYPRAFRAEFGAELQAVFAQAAAESRGWMNVLRLFLRELRDLPENLLRQHWAVLRDKLTSITTKREPGVDEWKKSMLRNKFMQIWRKITLLLMLIAICSPWMLEAEEPLPGILLFIHFFGGVFGSLIWVLTAERLLLEGLIMSFAGTWFMLAPIISMLLLIASKDQPFGGGERTHVRVLSSALAIGVIGIAFGVIELTGKVWGIWFYLFLLASELAMEVIMILSDTNRNATHPTPPGTWGAAILAGLPHLLMGLLIAVGKLLDPAVVVNQNFSAAFGIFLGLLVVGVLLFAWRCGWPLWSASWYIYGTWVTMAVFSLTFDKLNIQDSWRYLNVIFIGWIIFCIVGYFMLLAKSKLHGLLSIAFLFPLLSVQMIEFVPNPIEGWFALGLGLLAFFTTAAIIRGGDFRQALWLVLGVNLIAGLTFAYISEYQVHDLPLGHLHQPQFSNFLEILAFYSIFGLGVIAIPLILRSLWNFGKRRWAA
ncbi:MAG: hypothetical protein ACK2T5_05660 [Anaerolineales bacterium]